MRANAGNFSNGLKKMRPHAAACGQIGKSKNAGAAACGFLDKNVPAFFIPAVYSTEALIALTRPAAGASRQRVHRCNDKNNPADFIYKISILGGSEGQFWGSERGGADFGKFRQFFRVFRKILERKREGDKN